MEFLHGLVGGLGLSAPDATAGLGIVVDHPISGVVSFRHGTVSLAAADVRGYPPHVQSDVVRVSALGRRLALPRCYVRVDDTVDRTDRSYAMAGDAR